MTQSIDRAIFITELRNRIEQIKDLRVRTLYVHNKFCQQYSTFVKEAAELENTAAFEKVAQDYEQLIIAYFEGIIAKGQGELDAIQK